MQIERKQGSNCIFFLAYMPFPPRSIYLNRPMEYNAQCQLLGNSGLRKNILLFPSACYNT